jgi:transposase
MDSSGAPERHQSAKASDALGSTRKEESVGKHTTIAMDIAKNVFEVAVSTEPGRVKERRRLTKSQMLRFFANREPARVVIEACGTAHALARELEGYGHEMVLLPPGQVRRYVLRNKTDRTDTKGLLEADRNEEIVPVPVKTVGQQVLVAVHRLRSGWMATRTARLNAIRGFLRELGVTVPVGATRVLPALTGAMEAGRVPGTLEALLRTTAEEVRDLDRRIEEAESTLKRMAREMDAAVRLQTVPGIGLLTATALIGSVGEPGRFPSGRHLASFLGLVPRESSSGDRRRLGAITKRGDGYVRMLFTHGARSVLRAASVRKENDRLRTWALETQKRKGHNKATVALANKLTRIAWAVWLKDRPYEGRAPEETL